MQKYILTISAFALSCIYFSPLHANWISENGSCNESNATNITNISTLSFPKNEGKYTLCIKELAYFNPFLGHSITQCSGNSCQTSYYVDNLPFDASHELWTYNNSGVPNQKVPFWKYNKKTYWLDTSKPTCGTTTIVDGSNNPYLGGWSNVDLYSKTTCSDALSGCDTVKNTSANSLKQLKHGAIQTPSLTFFDVVGNVNSMSCSLPVGITKVLIDDRAPQVDNILMEGVDISEKSEIARLAGPIQIDIKTRDQKTTTYGVSGIKTLTAQMSRTHTYTGGLLQTTETTQQMQTREVCTGYFFWRTCHTEIYFEPITTSKAAPQEVCKEQYSASSEYNTNGTGLLPDIQNITLNCTDTSGFQIAGTYKLTITLIDFSGNKTEREIIFKIYPSTNITITPTFTLPRNPPFANNSDSYNYILTLKDIYGNPVYNKTLQDISIPEEDDIDLIANDKTSQTGLSLSDTILTTDIDGKMAFKITSYTPGYWNEHFVGFFPIWNESYQDTESIKKEIGNKQSLPFFAPFKGRISLLDDNNTLVHGLTFGQFHKIRVDVERLEGVIAVTPESINFLKHGEVGYPYDWIFSTDSALDIKQEYTQETSIDVSGKGYQITRFIPEQISKFSGQATILAQPIIRYVLGGKEVSYTLGQSYTGNTVQVTTSPQGPQEVSPGSNPSNDPITFTETDIRINPIYIEGVKYTNGKDGVRLDKLNIGSMNLADYGNIIRKNWSLKSRNRTLINGEIFDDIKYIKGNTSISGSIQGYKTLVVVDGNVTINGDLNTEKSDFGIIVLRTNSADTTTGHIYITPNVQRISAIVYTDGSIESVDNSGSIFTESNTNRANTLNKQIIFYGGIYTRNTVGGAVLGGQNTGYILPGNITTSDIHTAVRYDLSFLRMKNDGQALLSSWNQGHTEAVVILKNPNIIYNSLPVFGAN